MNRDIKNLNDTIDTPLFTYIDLLADAHNDAGESDIATAYRIISKLKLRPYKKSGQVQWKPARLGYPVKAWRHWVPPSAMPGDEYATSADFSSLSAAYRGLAEMMVTSGFIAYADDPAQRCKDELKAIEHDDHRARLGLPPYEDDE